MLYKITGFRPHSSSDPLTRATFPPGEEIEETFSFYQFSSCFFPKL